MAETLEASVDNVTSGFSSFGGNNPLKILYVFGDKERKYLCADEAQKRIVILQLEQGKNWLVSWIGSKTNLFLKIAIDQLLSDGYKFLYKAQAYGWGL